MHDLSRKPALKLAITLLAMSAATASAQSVAVFGAAETDESNLNLFLIGASTNPGRAGWQPYGSVVGYTIRGSGTSRPKSVLSPSVGLLNKYGGGQYQFGVGYAFADQGDDQGVFIGEGGGGDGVTTSFQWNHWGRRRQASQFIAAYNFGSEFLWTRFRQSFQLAEQSPLWVGGEAGILGGGEGVRNDFLVQFGPTVEWRFNPQFRLGASAGLKKGISEGNKDFDPWYLRAEFLWLPLARE